MANTARGTWGHAGCSTLLVVRNKGFLQLSMKRRRLQARSCTRRSEARVVLQGTRRGSKKSRGTEGEQSGGPASRDLFGDAFPPSSSCPPAPAGHSVVPAGDSPHSPAAQESHQMGGWGRPWLHWTTLTGKEAPMAAGLFSNPSHTYPGNYHICYRRALVKLLEGSGNGY